MSKPQQDPEKQRAAHHAPRLRFALVALSISLLMEASRPVPQRGEMQAVVLPPALHLGGQGIGPEQQPQPLAAA